MGRGRPSESNYPDRSKPAIGVAMFAEASPPSERGHTLRLEYHLPNGPLRMQLTQFQS